MAEGITLEDVWALFKATNEKIDRLAGLHAETEAAQQRTEEAQQRTEHAQQRTEAAQQRTEAALQNLSLKMSKLSDRIGEFAEGMVTPAIRQLLASRDIIVHSIYPRVYASFDDKETDFDLILENADYVVAVEIKSRVKVQDVDEHLDRMRHFRRYLPRFADGIAIGAIAGMVVDEDAGKYAYRNGLFVLAQSGDTVKILNDQKFRPKHW